MDLQTLFQTARENCLPTFSGNMKTWTFVIPQVHWWLWPQAIADGYCEPLAAIWGYVKPQRYLAIGALFGTLESYMLKKTGWQPESIVLCDMDAEMYNLQRDSMSYAYKNITGPKFGNYQKHLIMVRDSSHSTETARTLKALQPFNLIYVDGDHKQEGAYADICLAHSLLADNGIILVHDLDLPEDDVRNAYARYLAEHPLLKHVELRDPDFKFGLGIVKREK